MRILIMLILPLWIGSTAHAGPAPDPTPPPDAPPGTPLQEGESLPEPPPGFGDEPAVDAEARQAEAYNSGNAPASADESAVVDSAETDGYEDPTLQEQPDPAITHGAEESGRLAPEEEPFGQDPGPDPLPGHHDGVNTMEEPAAGEEAPEGSIAVKKEAAEVIADRFPELADTVMVTSRRGLVTVEGTVPKLSQVLEIEDVLGRIGQNQLIVNKLVVTPPRRSDGEIAAELTAALEASASLSSHSIRFQVREQKVFMSGSAPDFATVRIAFAEAARVDGVAWVDIAAVRAP